MSTALSSKPDGNQGVLSISELASQTCQSGNGTGHCERSTKFPNLTRKFYTLLEEFQRTVRVQPGLQIFAFPGLAGQFRQPVCVCVCVCGGGGGGGGGARNLSTATVTVHVLSIGRGGGGLEVQLWDFPPKLYFIVTLESRSPSRYSTGRSNKIASSSPSKILSI